MGPAMGLLTPSLFREDAGDHKYVIPPDALSWVVCPFSMVIGFADTEITGGGLMATAAEAVAVHPLLSVTVTVYMAELREVMESSRDEVLRLAPLLQL